MKHKTIVLENLKNKLIIGTAQLFNDYGIANFTKKKDRKQQAEKIINYCIKKNLNKFDTASGYNNEKFISDLIFKKKNKKFNPTFITKISSLKNFNEKNKLYKIESSINLSLKNLNEIDTILFHDQKDIEFTLKKFDKIKKILNYYKIQNFGFSIYDLKYFSMIKELNEKITLQLPINIINDQYLKKKFHKKHKIIARSVFMQGFLTSKKTKFNKNLKKINKLYFKYLEENSIKSLELSSSILLNKKINEFVLGFETVHQIDEVLKTKINYQKFNCHIKNIKKIFNKKKYYDPRKWEQ